MLEIAEISRGTVNPMLRSSIVVAVILLHSGLAVGQWSSFKPVTEDLLPEDQRDIRSQTVVKGNVVDKEIRVDWYGFTLVDDSNVVEDRFQYPVADPTLAPGDRIIRVHTKDVKDAAEVVAALRASTDKSPVSIVVERDVAGETETERIALHRAQSPVLKGLFDRRIWTQPPPFRAGDVGNWGGVNDLNLAVVTTADNGERIYKGSIFTSRGDAIDVEYVVIRGWKRLTPREQRPVVDQRRKKDPPQKVEDE